MNSGGSVRTGMGLSGHIPFFYPATAGNPQSRIPNYLITLLPNP